jgi:hypothetical protein
MTLVVGQVWEGLGYLRAVRKALEGFIAMEGVG